VRGSILLAALLASLGCGLAYAAAFPASREAAEASATATRLETDAMEARGAAMRARLEADALVARIDAAEAEITSTQTRLLALDRLRAARAARLAEEQQPAAALTAALVTLSRRPPALALVQPGSLQDAVRARAVLHAALPAIEARTAALRAEAAAGNKLKAATARTLAAQASAQDDLRARRRALAAVEAREIQRSRSLAGQWLMQSDQALALGEEARLALSRTASDAQAVAAAKSLASLPGPPLRPDAGPVRRLSRAVYRLPVEGRLLTGFGELSSAGVHSRGLTLAVAAESQALAPAGGRIAYAGGFRSYGEIVIIDHGGGWTSLVTGLASIGVRAGDRVAMGFPIGRTGTRPVTVELRRNGTPFPAAPLIALG
jgi:septal ring factor EnvC (AmiA/AmiB activator)